VQVVLEEIKAAQARKPDIEQYTGWFFQIGGLQKVLSRWKGLIMPSSSRFPMRRLRSTTAPGATPS